MATMSRTGRAMWVSRDAGGPSTAVMELLDGLKGVMSWERDQIGHGCTMTLPAASPDSSRICALPSSERGNRESITGSDRKSVVSGKRVSVRVDLGGRRTIKKKKHE